MSTTTDHYDVAVIGAGSAGLQAAQTLGRMHQRTLVLGTDRYRNDPAAHMHNVLGHDGQPPAELRSAGRRDAELYCDVDFRDVAVESVSGELGSFALGLVDGIQVSAARVLLATGVRDTLPDVPGVAAEFGGLVAHCPFCHGHEFAGRRIGVIGSHTHLGMFTSMLLPISSDLVVLTHGEALDPDTDAGLARLGVPVINQQVVGLRREADVLTVHLADGSTVEFGGLFVKTDWAQSVSFPADLGLEMSEVGAVVIDAFGRTSVPGVYAAGDLASGPGLPMPMASVLAAASAGLLAAAACVQDAAADRLRDIS